VNRQQLAKKETACSMNKPSAQTHLIKQILVEKSMIAVHTMKIEDWISSYVVFLRILK